MSYDLNPSEFRGHNDHLIESSRDATKGDGYFYSLCQPKQTRKRRVCLRCRVPFVSDRPGNRRCGNCLRVVSHG